MSMYDEFKVTVTLGDLTALIMAANCFEHSDNKLEKAEKRVVELNRIYEEQAAEIKQLLVRLSEVGEQKPRELSPLFKKRVVNAADVLRCHMLILNDNGETVTVDCDCYNAVRKALADLYDVIMIELPEVTK